MNAKQFFCGILFLGFSSLGFSQVNPNPEGTYADWNHGTGGMTIGSKTDNTYSALVINGALLPSYDGHRDLVFKFRSAGTALIRSFRDGSMGTYLQFHTTGTNSHIPYPRMHIDRTGNVGIGTTAPKYLLDVNGTIRAKEIRVESTGADFVFEDDYELLSLEEVENHIKEKRHLPDIPSAKEMQENGMSVGELNTKLLQKIEELTLYTIQQSKLLEEQMSIIQHQGKEIDNLKLQINK